jgi:hypothetical protein
MPTWIKLKTKERPYYDPRNGKVLKSIEGRRNRPGVDPFEGGGRVYPPIPDNVRVLDWQERGETLMLLVEGEAKDIDRLKGLSGTAQYRASPKETREYDLSEHAPVERSNAEALDDLKQEVGLPDGTTLDAEGKALVPDDDALEAVK